MFFRNRSKNGSAAAVADPGELFAEISSLTESNRSERDPAKELRLRELRHQAGIALVSAPPRNPVFPEPAPEAPPRNPVSKLPEITPGELTAELLRAAILDSGCLIVRGLLDE